MHDEFNIFIRDISLNDLVNLHYGLIWLLNVGRLWWSDDKLWRNSLESAVNVWFYFFKSMSLASIYVKAWNWNKLLALTVFLNIWLTGIFKNCEGLDSLVHPQLRPSCHGTLDYDREPIVQYLEDCRLKSRL